jgi:predicted adenylyl cyclase CyaB
MSRKNLEIKIPYRETIHTSYALKLIADKFPPAKKFTERQRDIYYDIRGAKLKLRIINNKSGNLIYYKRKDSGKDRISEYSISETKNFNELNFVLSKLSKVKIVVEKTRNIYTFDNIRIHLDKVANLGEFLEIEIIIDKITEARKTMKFLIKTLRLDEKNFIKASYSDLLLKNKQY